MCVCYAMYECGFCMYVRMFRYVFVLCRYFVVLSGTCMYMPCVVLCIDVLCACMLSAHVRNVTMHVWCVYAMYNVCVCYVCTRCMYVLCVRYVLYVCWLCMYVMYARSVYVNIIYVRVLYLCFVCRVLCTYVACVFVCM